MPSNLDCIRLCLVRFSGLNLKILTLLHHLLDSFLVKRCRLRERALVMEIKGDDLGQGRQSTGPVHVCLRGAISREFESAPSLEELEEENR